MASILGNVELTFSEEQGMLLDVAREFFRNRAPMETRSRGAGN